MKKSNLIGDCRDEKLVNKFFNSVTNFAQIIEKKGNEFEWGEIEVTYDKKKDIHYFRWK